MICEKCGRPVILKSSSRVNGVLSKYWQCPICGWEHIEERKADLDDVVLK